MLFENEKRLEGVPIPLNHSWDAINEEEEHMI